MFERVGCSLHFSAEKENYAFVGVCLAMKVDVYRNCNGKWQCGCGNLLHASSEKPGAFDKVARAF